VQGSPGARELGCGTLDFRIRPRHHNKCHPRLLRCLSVSCREAAGTFVIKSGYAKSSPTKRAQYSPTAPNSYANASLILLN
jgi:hypothetical protein